MGRFDDEEDPYVLDDVEVKHATDKALLIITDDGEELWIPRSQIVDDGTTVKEKGDTGELAITRWIAKEKGLVDE